MSFHFSWIKSPNVPFPHVWHRFQAKGLDGNNLVEYRIQDLPEKRFDDGINFLIKNCLFDRPSCAPVSKVFTDGILNEDVVSDHVNMWKDMLKQKMTFCCFREGSDDIVGINLVYIVSKDDDFFGQGERKLKSQGLKDVFEAFRFLYKDVNIFEKYNVNSYMSAFGLCVAKEYRGRRIGLELLKARKPICQANNITLTNCTFTSGYSSRVADIAGFKLEKGITYEEFEKIDPRFTFPNIDSKEATIKTWVF